MVDREVGGFGVQWNIKKRRRNGAGQNLWLELGFPGWRGLLSSNSCWVVLEGVSCGVGRLAWGVSVVGTGEERCCSENI